MQAIKKDFNIFTSLLECFHIGNNRNVINTIVLTVKTSENNYERIIELKSTSGVIKYLFIFLEKRSI